jgi:CheY-like chemotaxis protein
MKEKHQLHVVVRADTNVDPINEDARAFLFQSVRELLFNVVKHSGGFEAEVSLMLEEPDRLRICVSDHGKGFSQPIDSGGADTKPGFGMLGISERLAMMSGKMEVVSTPGEGTRVTLTVQIRRPEPVETAVVPQVVQVAAVDPADHQTPPRGTIRVLLADDHQIFREGLASVLASHSGIEVVGQARNGREALELARSLRPHVVTMDIAMPGLAGTEAAALIVRELRDVKVIALSMHAEDEYASAMRRAGVAAYLPKDTPAHKLVGVIRECCECGPAPDLISPGV